MKQENKHKKIDAELWRYKCKRCGNKDGVIERSYDRPIGVKLCSACGSIMEPVVTSIKLNNILKERITIKLN